MANTPTERAERLADWLRALVDLLQAEPGPLRTALVDATAGREAVIRLDDIALHLAAVADSGGVILDIGAVDACIAADFFCDAQTLRDVINGIALLDTVIVDGRIEVRAPLPSLLAMHALVLKTLAQGALRHALRQLWREFDAYWPRPEVRPCPALDRQRPHHGRLIRQIPVDVLLVGKDG
ncbi:MAG: hypothetical protein ACU836_14835 [Gammaproteobacteria bacterium]